MADKAYVFYSVKEKDLHMVYAKEVPYTGSEELSSSVAAVVKELLAVGNVEYLIVQHNQVFPDTKAIFFQNELINMAKKTSQAIQSLERRIEVLSPKEDKLPPMIEAPVKS